MPMAYDGAFIDEYLDYFSNSQLLFNFVYLSIWAVIIFFASRFFKKIISENVINTSVRYKLKKTVAFLSYILLIIISIIIFKKDIGNIAVAMGVIGGGIAFALQEVIVSIAGWLAITLSSFYNIGDRVKLGATTGDVIDIGILRTTLMECGEWVDGDQYTGRIVRIANSYIFKDPVYNYSGDFPFLWDELKVPVRYGSEVDTMEKIMLEVADKVIGDYSYAIEKSWVALTKKFAIEEARIKPTVFVVANDNWIEFSLRYVVDYKKRRDVKTLLYLDILRAIDKTDGNIKVASSTIEIVNEVISKKAKRFDSKDS